MCTGILKELWAGHLSSAETTEIHLEFKKDMKYDIRYWVSWTPGVELVGSEQMLKDLGNVKLLSEHNQWKKVKKNHNEEGFQVGKKV